MFYGENKHPPGEIFGRSVLQGAQRRRRTFRGQAGGERQNRGAEGAQRRHSHGEGAATTGVK